MTAAPTSNEANSDVSQIKSFPAGKLDSTTPDTRDNPTAIVRDFVQHRSTSVKEDVSAGVALSKGIAAVRGDKAKTAQFLAELTKIKAISKNENQIVVHSKKTTISMYAKIATYADIFLDDRVLSLLPTGYTTLYYAALLYEVLEEEPDAPKRFREILSSCDGPITKRFLMKERQKLDAKPESEPTHQPSKAAEDIVQSDPLIHETTEPIDDGSFSALLVSLRSDDVRKLAKSYPGELPFCLRMHELRANDAQLLVHARLTDLVAVSDKLPCWGFARFDKIYLLSPPQHPDASEVEVLGISRWGKPQMNPIECWPDHADALTLADRLLAGVEGKKIHLFAQSRRDGWDSVVGNANWVAADSNG